ncbi:LptF/LptG family permease [Natronospora cellulosivora (SeqCode)]
MKIIYKYIFKELLIPVIFGAAAFTGIFVGTDLLFKLIDYYTSYGVNILTLLQLFFLNLPAIVIFTLPMATLLGTIMAFGRLSGDSEITALRAGGISIYKIVAPAIITGLIMTFITIGVHEYLVPRANNISEEIVWEFRHGQRRPNTQSNLLLPNTDSRGRPDFFLYTRRFDGDTGEMLDVIFQDYEDGRPIQLIEAEKAIWREDGGWQFIDGRIIYLTVGERIPAITFAEYTQAPLDFRPAQISQLAKSISDMNYSELRERIELERQQGKSVNKELIELYHRISIPFANVIFALLAAVLGIQPQRSGGSATGMGISLAVIFVYYTIMTIGSALGEQGTISPFLGAWVQNFVFMIVGFVLLYRVAK